MVLKELGALRSDSLKIGTTDARALQRKADIKLTRKELDRIGRSMFP